MTVESLALFAQIAFVTFLLAGVITYIGLAFGVLKWQTVFPHRSARKIAIPKVAVLFVALWIGIMLLLSYVLPLLMPTAETSPASEISSSPFAMALIVFFELGLTLVFLLIIILIPYAEKIRNPFAGYGIALNRFPKQIELGVWGMSISLPVVILFGLLTIPFRASDEPSNELLQLLFKDQSPAILAGVFILAVFIAPLKEELMFRVVLQRWFEERWGTRSAVIVTAVIFSAVHGFPDMVGLFPLALILGLMYARGHHFFSVFFLHASFNAVMLCLAWASAVSQ